MRVYAGGQHYLNLVEVEVYDALGNRLQLSNGALGAAMANNDYPASNCNDGITGSSGEFCHSTNDPGKNYVSFAFSTAALEVTVKYYNRCGSGSSISRIANGKIVIYEANTPSLTVEQDNIINPGQCASKEYTLKLGSLIGGKHTIADSVHDCYICQRSRYIDQTGQTSCKWCIAGKYLSDNMVDPDEHDNSNDCDLCGDGQYRIQTYDSSGCVNCAAGKYVSGSSASDHASESNCKYADEADIAIRDMDLATGIAGKYITDHEATVDKHDNSNDCAVCARGQYRTMKSNTICLLCASGRYIK